jgi:hypothetical protein
MESVPILNITDCKTPGLATVFLNCQTITISGVPVAGLKEFYCIQKNSNIPNSTPCS